MLRAGTPGRPADRDRYQFRRTLHLANTPVLSARSSARIASATRPRKAAGLDRLGPSGAPVPVLDRDDGEVAARAQELVQHLTQPNC